MKLLVLSFSMIHCFPVPAVPEIDADVDYEHQSVQLRNCIRETTDSFIEDVVAAGGLPTDRLQYSTSQIQQLCLATQTTQQISASSTSPLIIEIDSTTSTSTESENGIDSVINLIQELETFRIMLSPVK